MNLVNSRDKWRQGFDAGKYPAFMNTYKHNRNSEAWRVASSIEELCEYILFLEEQIERKTNET